MKCRITSVILVLALTACTTNPYTGEREATNKAKAAGIGAAIGAVAGVLVGKDADDRRKKALIGAGVGALAGTAVGAYMDAQENKLRQQLQGTGVSVTRIGDDLVLNMPSNVTFDINRSELKPDFNNVLNSVALVLAEYNKTLIDVTGHTDSTGTVAHNMDLSDRRARVVGQYLQSQGVVADRVLTQGFGPHYPVASNDDPNGRLLNRRVELALKPIRQG